jgi:hypothetical protein
LEGQERLLVTLERLQGAILAGSQEGIDLQSALATSILRELEFSFSLASSHFSSLASLFGPNNQELHDLFMQMSELSGLSRPGAMFFGADTGTIPPDTTNPPATSVPDAGSSVLLLGMALAAIGGIRRKLNVCQLASP